MPKLTIGGESYSTGAEFPDEGLIMAYIDDELDDEGRRYVEDLLARSAEAREIADLMRSSTALLKAAFLDDAKTDGPAKSAAGTLPEPPRENPNAMPTPPTIKQTRLCRPMPSAAATNARLQRKA